jgi:hypothetical protein
VVRILTLALVAALATLSSAQSSPKDEKDPLKAAIHRLGELGSYAWSVSVTHSGETEERYAWGPCDGKTEKGGVTWIRSRETPPIEILQKGGKMAVRLEDGWAAEQDLGGQAKSRRHANLSLVRSLKGAPHPAAQAQELLKVVKDLGPADGHWKGILGPEAAKEQLHKSLRTSGRSAKISDASGWVAFWIQDGILVRYEAHVQGSVSFDPAGSSSWAANETRTVELSGLGTTKVEVPDEARKALE